MVGWFFSFFLFFASITLAVISNPCLLIAIIAIILNYYSDDYNLLAWRVTVTICVLMWPFFLMASGWSVVLTRTTLTYSIITVGKHWPSYFSDAHLFSPSSTQLIPTSIEVLVTRKKKTSSVIDTT